MGVRPSYPCTPADAALRAAGALMTDELSGLYRRSAKLFDT